MDALAKWSPVESTRGQDSMSRSIRHGNITRIGARRRQKGMSMTTAMLVVSVSVFLGLFAFKVGPNYFENWTVQKIAADTATNADLMKTKSKGKIYAHLARAYRTNSLWDLEPEDTIELVKNGNRGWDVHVKYEKRENLFSNIYVVTAFDNIAGE